MLRRQNDNPLDPQGSTNDTSGGGYFVLDNQDRAIIVQSDNLVRFFKIIDNDDNVSWVVDEEFHLKDKIPAASKVTVAMPDWSVLLWFVSREGIVGTINTSTGEILTMTLDNEEIQNAIAIASDGVFVLSDFALYRFETDSTRALPFYTFREEYERATEQKPGLINAGSGTAPTLLGDDLIAIADNADGRSNVLVCLRGKNVATERLIVKQPFSRKGKVGLKFQ